VLKGHKPSAIRFLLTSVPYRHQLNFTFDGLRAAASNVDKLRNFRQRLTTGQFPAGASETMSALARETADRIKAGLDDDLNTAQAQAAIFDMIRKANAAIDAGALRQEDVPSLLAVLQTFDEIFAVLTDDDAAKMASVLEWAKAEGRESDISAELLEGVRASQLVDEHVNQKIAEMEQARKSRDFKRSDSLRAELVGAGIVVENTKDGVRWRRK
jgi:cysteinyl-tRNA synthetase